jgi:hypothetical protein
MRGKVRCDRRRTNEGMNTLSKQRNIVRYIKAQRLFGWDIWKECMKGNNKENNSLEDVIIQT